MDDGTRITTVVEHFLRAAKARKLPEVQEMLAKNPSLLNCAEAGGYSAMHFAAFNGDDSIVSFLLSKGADVNVENLDGNTPLVMAVKGRHLDTIRILVDSGADINKMNAMGTTAIHHAAAMGYVDCLFLLQELKANTVFNRIPVGTLLHWATHSGDLKTVGTVMYRMNVPVDAEDAHGGTPLMVAIHMNKLKVVAFLLEHGADPNCVVCEDGTTPLHMAMELNSAECVKILCKCKANPQLTNKKGLRPADYGKPGTACSSELEKAMKEKGDRLAESLKMKNQGNRVFQNGENMKAIKFYTLAIHLDASNHILFSNRAACYFKLGELDLAYFDACRCLRLDPTFVRGYVRLSAACLAMGKYDEAMEAAEKGLALDPSNSDLATIRADAFKKRSN